MEAKNITKPTTTGLTEEMTTSKVGEVYKVQIQMNTMQRAQTVKVKNC